MKPFDLDLATSGNKIIYRNEKGPVNWHLFPEALETARIVTVDSFGYLYTHNSKGRRGTPNGLASRYDLFMADRSVELDAPKPKQWKPAVDLKLVGWKLWDLR